MDVSGATCLDSTVKVYGALDVSGATCLDSTVKVYGALDISGATTIDAALTVNSNSTFNSRVDICGNFYAVYPDNSIPAAAIIGDVGGGGGMSSDSILQQF